MSSKGGRFDTQLSRLKAGAGAEPRNETGQKEQPVSVPTMEREKFTTYIKPGMKLKLKLAVAKEGRKQYEVLDEMLEEWLERHHPDLL